MTSLTPPEAIGRLERGARRHIIEHEGRAVCWREFGPAIATPLVLLHGGHGSWLHWIANIEALSATHRVLAPDMPGYGESDALPEEAGLPELLDLLDATLDRLVGAGAPFDLAGFSFGGVVAGCLAARRAGVRKLALLGAVGHGRRRRQTGVMLAWQNAKDEATLLARLRHNLGVLMLRGPADPLALEIHHRCCVGTRFHSARISLSPALTEALARLDAPVLMLWGEHDATGDPHEVGPLWRAGRPERACQVVPAAGHWVQYEASEAVNRSLRDWFADDRVSSPSWRKPSGYEHEAQDDSGGTAGAPAAGAPGPGASA